MDKDKVYLGIDPGVGGGAGIVDSTGRYVDAWRWNKRNPLETWHKLMGHAENIHRALIEVIRPFPGGAGKAFMTLAENAGAWKMMMILQEIAWGEIEPNSWQSQVGLYRWKKRQETNPAQASPLTLARQLWPDASLRFLADDGMAVGLILADLARQDAQRAKMASPKPAGEAIATLGGVTVGGL
jgi:hypothetical protein